MASPTDPGGPGERAAAGAAAVVLDLALTRPPTLGAGRLVCVDGPAGSGKTSLSGALATLHPRTQVVHADDLLRGWTGLPGLAASLDAFLRPMRDGGPGTWWQWDWAADDWAGSHEVAPLGADDLLVVDGVGSGAPVLADLTTVLVWVEAPRDLRLRRGLDRDGEAMRPHWERWALDEDALHAADGTARRADVVVDGATATVTRLPPPSRHH